MALANALRKFGELEYRGLPNKLFEQTDIQFEHWVGTEGVRTLRMRLPSRIDARFSFGGDNFVTIDKYLTTDAGVTETYRGDTYIL